MSVVLLESLEVPKLPKEQITSLFRDIDSIILDCDGVLWIKDTPIAGSVETFNKLKSLGKRIFLLTNNSTKTRQDFFLKATNMGFDIEMESIVTTGSLVALYLSEKKFIKKVYVIGSRGIADELKCAGIDNIGYGPDVLQHSIAQTIDHFSPDPDVNAVVVGFDEHFCYTKLLKAASYLSKPSCIFLATNTIERYPISSSLIIPGTGAIVRSVEAVAQRDAIIMGKPNSLIGHVMTDQFGVNPKRTLLIGDRCDTDIVLGFNCGYQTLLVLSGFVNNLSNHKRSSKRLYSDNYIPDYFMSKLADFLPFL